MDKCPRCGLPPESTEECKYCGLAIAKESTVPQNVATEGKSLPLRIFSGFFIGLIFIGLTVGFFAFVAKYEMPSFIKWLFIISAILLIISA